jgi:hypothetical protein
MRTTLTLDPDVYEEIQRLRNERGLKTKELVNSVLRLGLVEMRRARRGPRFRTRAVSLGPKSSNLDDVAEVLALAEGDSYR